MAQWNQAKVWDELCKSQPFLVSLMCAIAQKEAPGDHSKIPQGLRSKFVMIYSVLMFERWHELSLFQRTTTVLLVDGGCSKKVFISLMKFSKRSIVLGW